MIFDILTLFPGMFASPFQESIVGKALQRGLIQLRIHNIRDYATDKHQVTDDRPFGGGEGMVMKPEPILRALESMRYRETGARVILLTPQGRLFSQETAWKLSRLPRLILVCGRYEGVDERIAEHFVNDQISIGDYVLTGGELAGMVLVDAVTRLIPGCWVMPPRSKRNLFLNPCWSIHSIRGPKNFRAIAYRMCCSPVTTKSFTGGAPGMHCCEQKSADRIFLTAWN